jgi:hypothetical protein
LKKTSGRSVLLHADRPSAPGIAVEAGFDAEDSAQIVGSQHFFRRARADLPSVVQQDQLGTELEFVIMVIAVSCVKLLSAHNSTQHTSRKHKV